MDNNGSSDVERAVSLNPNAGQRQAQPFVPLVLLVLTVVGLLLAFYVGTNVLGVLFGIVAPPLPPLPDALVETSHTSPSYGVDQWIYHGTGDPCAAVAAFEEFGTCAVAPMQCGPARSDLSGRSGETVVARCRGKQQFSIFTMQWRALVSRENADGTTWVDLEREVFWIGTGEPASAAGTDFDPAD